MIDVEFPAFMQRLKQAGLAGERIEQKDKERWQAYIKAHGVRETACLVHGKSLSENIVPVIIDSSDRWAGFYVYAKDEEIALRYQG